MNREQVLALLKRKLEDGTITKEDLSFGLEDNQGIEPKGIPYHVENNNQIVSEEESDIGSKMARALYLIGSLIIITGVLILLAQNWEEIGFLGRMGSTLGVAIVAYVVGFLTNKESDQTLSQLCFLISAMLIPAGIYIFLYEIEYEITLNVLILILTTLSVLFGITQYFVRNRILVLVVTFFSTSLYVTLVSKLVENSLFANTEDVFKWATIILGISYFVIAYGYINYITNNNSSSTNQENAVSRILYVLGSFFILGPIMTFSGIWDFLIFLVIFAIAYVGFFVKSRTVFFIASLFLVIKTIYLTWKYFSGSIGWPIMLILIGGLVIGISYSSIKISKNITL